MDARAKKAFEKAAEDPDLLMSYGEPKKGTRGKRIEVVKITGLAFDATDTQIKFTFTMPVAYDGTIRGFHKAMGKVQKRIAAGVDAIIAHKS
jgi:hypothetical protein